MATNTLFQVWTATTTNSPVNYAMQSNEPAKPYIKVVTNGSTAYLPLVSSLCTDTYYSTSVNKVRFTGEKGTYRVATTQTSTYTEPKQVYVSSSNPGSGGPATSSMSHTLWYGYTGNGNFSYTYSALVANAMPISMSLSIRSGPGTSYTGGGMASYGKGITTSAPNVPGGHPAYWMTDANVTKELLTYQVMKPGEVYTTYTYMSILAETATSTTSTFANIPQTRTLYMKTYKISGGGAYSSYWRNYAVPPYQSWTNGESSKYTNTASYKYAFYGTTTRTTTKWV